MNKRGLEMAVTTVIMIILSIAVLTILIIFVNSQTGFLSRWFRGYESESNVDVVVSACNNLVATESVYSYCCEERDVVLNGKDKLELTCGAARVEGWSSGKINEMSCDGIVC
ncbi:MAG: hypothetical protein V1889_00615 [archaeon]